MTLSALQPCFTASLPTISLPHSLHFRPHPAPMSMSRLALGSRRRGAHGQSATVESNGPSRSLSPTPPSTRRDEMQSGGRTPHEHRGIRYYPTIKALPATCQCPFALPSPARTPSERHRFEDEQVELRRTCPERLEFVTAESDLAAAKEAVCT